MRVLVTGATGWVSSAVVKELVEAGHQVTGLVRSDQKAAVLAAVGPELLHGTFDDLDALRSTPAAADAVIHTAFSQNFSKLVEACEQDRRAIEVLGSALEETDRPLLVTIGIAMLALGRVATEADVIPPDLPLSRESEAAARALIGRGIHAATLRLAPSVLEPGDHGFIQILIGAALEKGVSAYIGEGLNRWPGVHRLDAGRWTALPARAGAGRARARLSECRRREHAVHRHRRGDWPAARPAGCRERCLISAGRSPLRSFRKSHDQ